MPKSRRTPAPKKCIQTSCGNTCIPTTKTCRITEPKAQSNIKRKTSDLKRAVDKEVEAAFKTGRAIQAESVIKNLSQTGTKKRSKTETMKRGSAILEKYGTPSDSRSAVDRMVEAGTKTRRKPQTESEKTAKVIKREQAQRIIRELQQKEEKVDNENNKSYKREKTGIKNMAQTTLTKTENNIKGPNESKWDSDEWFTPKRLIRLSTTDREELDRASKHLEYTETKARDKKLLQTEIDRIQNSGDDDVIRGSLSKLRSINSYLDQKLISERKPPSEMLTEFYIMKNSIDDLKEEISFFNLSTAQRKKSQYKPSDKNLQTEAERNIHSYVSKLLEYPITKGVKTLRVKVPSIDPILKRSETEINYIRTNIKDRDRADSAYDDLKSGKKIKAKGREFIAEFPKSTDKPVKITSGTLEYELKNDEYVIKTFLEKLTK